jgi:predicted DNA binding CopG/RHH family protein
MLKLKKDYQLEEEEKEILEAYENGVLGTGPVSESIVLAAKETMKKSKNINISISENDLESIKLLAAREGMPYQILISSLIHKYASGYL